jgi:hypothetical protein
MLSIEILVLWIIEQTFALLCNRRPATMQFIRSSLSIIPAQEELQPAKNFLAKIRND